MRKAEAIKQPIKKGVAKVPVVLQITESDCGAAAFSMLLAYYGKWIPLEKVKADCGCYRDGFSVDTFLNRTKNYDMTVSLSEPDFDGLKAEGSFPCIIGWDREHFSVLCGFKGDKAVLNDPKEGHCYIEREEFDRHYSGECLSFRPMDSFTPSGKPKRTRSFIRACLKGSGRALVFLAFATTLSALIGVWKPGFSKLFLDGLLSGENPDWLVPFTLALSAVCAAEVVINALVIFVRTRIVAKVASYGSASFMWKVLCLPIEYFYLRMVGDIQERQAANNIVADTLVNIITPLVINIVLLGLYAGVMISYSLRLTILGIVAVMINSGIALIVSKKRTDITRKTLRDEGELAGKTVAGIEMIDSIKACGSEEGFFEQWADSQAKLNAQKCKYAKLDSYIGTIPLIISSITEYLTVGLGIIYTIRGEYSVGMILVFQGLLTAFLAPAQDMIAAGQAALEMRTKMEQIDDVMQYPSDRNYDVKQSEEKENYKKLNGEIEIRNVNFGFSVYDAPLIKDFNISIPQGRSVGIVGPSGCGKSTLAKLVAGLYHPWSGEILFDGTPIEEIDRDSFTSSVSVVDQDMLLFQDTISNNIRMWDSTIENFEVILAARDVGIHDNIMTYDEGYDCRLMENGKNICGGQRQQVEIARALVNDPSVIILDEATSALDAHAENEIMRSIIERGSTCIIIAHRLSAIRDCDEIIVMEHGKVVERGKHEELYKKGGLYTRLVQNE